MNILNLSTLKLNDSHSYYGGAIGNIAYELLAHLARHERVDSVVSLCGGAEVADAPADLYLIECDSIHQQRHFAKEHLPTADVATHLYFHDPEWSPVADLPAAVDTPFVLGMVEAPHERRADERSGLARIGPLRRLGKRVYRRLHRATWRRADSAVFVTADARVAYAHLPGPSCGAVVPYGVDHDRFTPGNGHATDPRILAVSRLIERRGLHTLIDALARVHDVHPEATVHLVGEGPQREALARRAKRRGVRESVTFHGHVDARALAEQYRRAAAFVHLSRDDGWNQPALEAMASATPVVAADQPHNPMVVDGVTGHRVAAVDPVAVAEAVTHLLSAPETADRYGRQARAIVERDHDWARIADRYVSIYEANIQAANG